jgi:hypothetical protein
MKRNEPLYRKENTRTHGAKHDGGEFKWSRNSRSSLNDISLRGSMHGKKRLGYDYTPLFKFLLSRVGAPWDKVYSDAVARLDRDEPIFWLVARSPDEGQDYVRIGESTYYSGLFVDESGVLSIVNPNLKLDDMKPFCGCCTHTFNGQPFTHKFVAS